MQQVCSLETGMCVVCVSSTPHSLAQIVTTRWWTVAAYLRDSRFKPVNKKDDISDPKEVKRRAAASILLLLLIILPFTGFYEEKKTPVCAQAGPCQDFWGGQSIF